MLPTITVDIGTTSIKMCVFDDAGDLCASARRETPTLRDQEGEIYDVEALLAAVTSAVS